jgi:hypothetical protein
MYGGKVDKDSEKNNGDGNKKLMYGNTGNNGKGGYKGPAKPIKGDCQECRKQGHKAMDCYSTGGNRIPHATGDENINGNQNNCNGNSENKNGGGKFIPHTERTCYHCNKKGHIAAHCLEKNQESGLVGTVFCPQL